MTNPVVLYGTQSNGETLPVQVDATGRLVAEGLQGIQGPPGDQGPQGEPGVIDLPPDPFEGALLGWLNGELAWVGSPPIVIPEGVYGPITSWDEGNSIIELAYGLPQHVTTGVYMTQVDEQGNLSNPSTTAIFNEKWSSKSAGYEPHAGKPLVDAWNGDVDTFALGANDWRLVNVSIPVSSQIKVYMHGAQSYSTTQCAAANQGDQYCVTASSNDMNEIPVVIPFSGELNRLDFFKSGASAAGVRLVEVDGRPLIDRDLAEVKLRVNNRLSDKSFLVVPTNQMRPTVGQYVYVPEQRVAPWVLYGNDPTSLIDHLRQTRD